MMTASAVTHALVIRLKHVAVTTLSLSGRILPSRPPILVVSSPTFPESSSPLLVTSPVAATLTTPPRVVL